MNLFEEVESLSGERLAVAGLRLLVLRAPTFRQAFLDLLDANSPIGPIGSDYHFACYSEHPTSDENLGGGRIDMVVEVDNAAIGVEAKLFGAFQESQPRKYAAEIERVASLLGKIRRTDVKSFIVVLAPASRSDEIRPMLSQGEVVVSWEDVIDRISSARGDADPFLAPLSVEFSQFLKRRIAFLPNLGRLLSHLFSQWELGGTQIQREFLGAVWQVFPRGSPRLGSGPNWVGYYFSPFGEDGPRGWFGFVPTERCKIEVSKNALLVVSLQGESDRSTERFMKIDMSEPIWVDGLEMSTYQLRVDDSWHTPNVWYECLSELAMVSNNAR